MSSMTIVERRGERRRIADTIASAHHGRGGAICLHGIAGIGKTALLQAALTEAEEGGATTAGSICWREGSVPYEPWLDVLCQLHVLDAADEWPYVPGLTGFINVERSLATATQSCPIVIGLDDLHSADEGTLLLTRYLAARAANSALVIVAVARDPNPTGLLSEVLRPFERITLQPLSDVAVRTMCSQRGYAKLDAAAIQSLAAATAGVPLQILAALASTPLDASQPNLTGDLAIQIADRLNEASIGVATIIAKAAVAGRICPANLAAHIAGVTDREVGDAIRAAQTLGLATTGTQATLEYRHDLVRQAARNWLTPAQRAEAEAGAADWFTIRSRSDPRLLNRAAHHTMAAAEADPRHARRAIELGRLAARSVAAQGSPDDGARILQRLLRINEATPSVSHAVLLLDHAQAVLRTGRLGAAIRHFDQAVDAALLECDPETVAEAAAGLGALWVNSVRAPATQAHVLHTQREALKALPAGFTSVHLRLRARIAAEAMFWEGGEPGPLVAVIDDTLRLGDPSTVLDVLSVAHNPLLGPQHTDLRLRLSHEMLSRTSGLESGVLPLMAACWRTVDLFLSGEPGALKSLAHLRRAAEATQSLSILYIVRAMETMVLIGHGHFAEAEAAAAEAYQLGCDAEDPDALGYRTGHIVIIGWYQGRDAELLAMMEQTAGNANIDSVDFSFDAAAAALAARAGLHDLARHFLNKIIGVGLEAVPKLSTWLITMALAIEAAAHLADRNTLARAYALLTPYAALPIMGSLAVISLGSCQQWLGRAALALGRLDVAERHLRAAIDDEIRLGHLPAATVSRILLAECWARQPDRTDPTQEMDSLLETCRHSAERHGMPGIIDRIAQLSRGTQDESRVIITRSGSIWSVQLAGEVTIPRNLLGMTILATLTNTPGTWIPATELVHGAVIPVSPDPLIDHEARRTLRQRMTQLAADISLARQQNDLRAQRDAEDELDQLSAYLNRSSGLGGRTRSFTDAAERARTSVRKAIMRAVDDIERTSPKIAAHLKTHIVTGTTCCYQLPPA